MRAINLSQLLGFYSLDSLETANYSPIYPFHIPKFSVRILLFFFPFLFSRCNTATNQWGGSFISLLLYFVQMPDKKSENKVPMEDEAKEELTDAEKKKAAEKKKGAPFFPRNFHSVWISLRTLLIFLPRPQSSLTFRRVR